MSLYIITYVLPLIYITDWLKQDERKKSRKNNLLLFFKVTVSCERVFGGVYVSIILLVCSQLGLLGTSQNRNNPHLRGILIPPTPPKPTTGTFWVGKADENVRVQHSQSQSFLLCEVKRIQNCPEHERTWGMNISPKNSRTTTFGVSGRARRMSWPSPSVTGSRSTNLGSGSNLHLESRQFHHPFLVGGWTTHLKNMLVKLDHFIKDG